MKHNSNHAIKNLHPNGIRYRDVLSNTSPSPTPSSFNLRDSAKSADQSRSDSIAPTAQRAQLTGAGGAEEWCDECFAIQRGSIIEGDRGF